MAGRQALQSSSVVENNFVGDLAGLRVVYVDDDRQLLKATHDLMKRWGIEVTITESVTNFKSMVALGQQFDVVLMDYQLGESANGLELLQLYKQKARHEF